MSKINKKQSNNFKTSAFSYCFWAY